MTQIDFYILEKRNDSRELFACHLAEKLFHQGMPVFIHTQDENQARQVDDLLWSFKADNFIPHARLGELDHTNTPILIGNGETPDIETEVLINLSQTVPLFFSRFQRVAEVVDNVEANKLPARDRFRFYRDRGYALKSHNL